MTLHNMLVVLVVMHDGRMIVEIDRNDDSGGGCMR